MCCKGWGKGCWVHQVVRVLVLVGGVNWGLVGLGMLLNGDWNVVNLLLGSWPTVEAIVYLLVGVAAVMKIFGCHCQKCMAACAECGGHEMGQKM